MKTVRRALGLLASIFLLGANTPAVHAASAPTTVILQYRDSTPGLDRAVKLHPTAPTRTLTVGVSLALRNQAQLESFIASVSNRKSHTYGHYLSPAQFAADYAPAQTQVQQVLDHLRKHGLTVTSVSSNRTLVDATGPVAAVEAAFGVSISDWHDRDQNRDFFGNDGNPTLPPSLASFVVGIAGLNNHYQLQRLGPSPHVPPGGGPTGGYTPTDLKTAYDVNPLASAGYNGTGQTLGLFELDAFRQANITTYDTKYGLGSPPPTVQSVDGGSGRLGNGEIEVELDIESMHAIAPAAAVTVWEGPNTDPGANDTYNAIVTSDTTTSNSTSWGICEPNTTAAEMTTLDNIFKQGAAQGQSFFAASGDYGAYDCGGSQLAVDSPANDPYITGAGGTTLTLNADSTYKSESAWSNPNTFPATGGGGGLSSYFAEPGWQSGPGVANSFSSGKRQVPDVSLDADPATGYSVYVTYNGSTGWTVVGGTSAAAPLWAAFTGVYNQYAAAKGKPNLGYANPTLYTTASNAQTFPPFADVATGNNLYYPATSGWDYATGWGSYDAYNMARDLAVSSNWPTYHRSNIRDGNDQTASPFATIGQTWISPTLDGHVYAEPLVVGNQVIVATENNSIYSLDATTGNPTWAQPANFGAPLTLTNPPFACGNISPLGITGTPAVDTVAGVIYAVAFVQPGTYKLVGVNLSNGARTFTPISISPTGFDPFRQQQRGALTLVNGYVNVPFGGYAGDCGSYHGWLIGVKADGSSTTLRIFQDQAQAVCASAPSPNEAAIWAPSGASADASGNLYVASGNGSSTTTYDCGETVFKLSPTLSYLDSWAPAVWASLNGSDNDVGSMGPTLVGTSNSLVFQSGKNGWGYLLKASSLSATANHIGGEAFNAPVCDAAIAANSQTAATDQVFGGVAYADPYIYVPCPEGIKALKLGAGPSFSIAWSSQTFNAAAPIISGGLIWAVDVSSNVLLAIDQATGTTRFVSASLGGQTHFSTPAAGQGRVYVADGFGDVIRAFGPTGVPAAPTAASATAGDASATVTWIAPGSDGGSPITGYRVTPYVGARAQTATTFNSTATSQTISGLTNGTTYTFTVAAMNANGSGADSAASNSVTPVAAITVSQAPQGNWVGTYGADGYALLGWNGSSDLLLLPQSTLVLDQGARYAWNPGTTDVRALQSPDAISRRATSMYASPQLRLHLTFTSAYAGTLHLYAIDWDSSSRRQLVTVDDGSGPRTANLTTAFNQGLWIHASINVASGGTVTITVDRHAGANAVLSGLFLGAPTTVPPAPTGLTATAASSTRIDLSWTGSGGVSGYRVERSPDGSTGWTLIATPSTTSYGDIGLTPATTYYYRVAATNSLGSSPPSTVASATTNLATSQAPQGNWVGTYGADGYALLGWNGSSDLLLLPQSTLVLDQGARYAWNTGTTDVRALQSPDATSRRATSMYASAQLRLHLSFASAYTGTLHLYAIDWDSSSRRQLVTVDDGSGPRTANLTTAFNQGLWIHASINVASGGTVTITVDRHAGANAVLSGLFLGAPTTVPPAPTGLTATAASSTRIDLSWTGSGGVSGYRVERSPDGSTGWTQIATPSSTSYSDIGLTASTTYSYRVSASNVVGNSAPSAVVSATTNLAISQAPQGTWVGTYGADGYALLGWNGSSDLVSLAQSSLILDQGARYAWNPGTTDARALQSPDATSRRATTIYASSQVKLHLSFPSAYTGTLHLYAIDWDSTTRRQVITVNDGSGPRVANLVSDFSQGAWVTVPITMAAGGTLTITVDRTAGANAVLSGLFLR